MNKGYDYYDKLSSKQSSEELRKIFFGSGLDVIQKRQREREMLEKSRANDNEEPEIYNKFGWKIEIIRGLTDYAKVSTVALEQPISLIVYPNANEKSLRPHLDICLTARQEVHLTVELLTSLIDVIKAAKLVLAGEETSYFNE